MNDLRIEERMLASVADEPPLGFDPDELVDRAELRRRRRRSAFGAAGAAAVVMVAAIAFGDRGEPDGVSPAQQPSTEDCRGRLGTVAPLLVTRHLPDVELTREVCGVADYLYRVEGSMQRFWLYRNENRPKGDFFADEEYSLVREEPVGDAVLRVYRKNYANGETGRAAIRLGPGGMVQWANITGRGELAVSEEQLVAVVSDPELWF